MKRSFFLLCFLFLFAACSTLPEIDPSGSRMNPQDASACRRLFPQGHWQFQHAIEATLPGGRKSVLIGISDVSAESGRIRSILMTIEGLVVFDAESDREIRILRAVPPFDSEPFARGLIHAIQLLFFVPPGDPVEIGKLPNGSAICRYQSPDKQMVDVVRNSDGRWRLQQYDRWFRKKRTVDIFFNNNFRFEGFQAPSRLKLTVTGSNGYTLEMDLIEAVFLKD